MPDNYLTLPRPISASAPVMPPPPTEQERGQQEGQQQRGGREARRSQEADWIMANKDKKGTDEFAEHAKEFNLLRPVGFGEQVAQAAGGFNVGYLANILGAPVDVVNWAIGGAGGEQPFGGSASIQRGLSAIGSAPESAEDVPYGARGAYRGGEFVGEVAGLATPVFGAASRLPAGVTAARAGGLVPPVTGRFATARNLGKGMVTQTAKAPGVTAATELAAGVGGGWGAVMAEEVAPGDEDLRMWFEMGGMLTPTVALATMTSKNAQALKSVVDRWRGAAAKAGAKGEGFWKRQAAGAKEMRKLAGAEPKAAELLRKKLAEEGEDVSALVTALKAEVGSRTAAQATASPTLTSLEKRLILDSKELGIKIEKQTAAAIKESNAVWRAAQGTGNPELISRAAQVRSNNFNNILSARVKHAKVRAQKAEAAIPGAGVASPGQQARKVEASKKARAILQGEKKLARKQESELWNLVDKKAQLNAKNSLAAYNEMKAELVVGEKLPAPIEAFFAQKPPKVKVGSVELAPESGMLRAMEEQGLVPGVTPPIQKSVEAGDLLRLRSRVLDAARTAKANSEFGDARRLGKIADGILDDLALLPGDAADVARAFSRGLNQDFKEGVVGKILGTSSKGGEVVAPSVTLEKAFGGTGEQSALNFDTLRRAARGNAEDMKDIQSTFISALVRDTVGFGEKVNLNKLDDFLAKYARNVEEMGLGDVLRTAGGKERLAQMVERSANSAKAFAVEKSAAGKVLKTKYPGEAVDAALKSANPDQEIKALVRLVKKSGDPAAVEGLRYSVVEELLKKASVSQRIAGEEVEVLSGRALDLLLRDKVKGKTLANTLVNSGLFTKEQAKGFYSLIRETAKFEKAIANTGAMDELFGQGSRVYDLLLRITGANIGAGSGLAQASGSSLVLASAGSKTMRDIFGTMPKLRARSVLMEAIQDPKYMADLLSMETSVAKRAATDRRIRLALINAGVIDPLRED